MQQLVNITLGPRVNLTPILGIVRVATMRSVHLYINHYLLQIRMMCYLNLAEKDDKSPLTLMILCILFQRRMILHASHWLHHILHTHMLRWSLTPTTRAITFHVCTSALFTTCSTKFWQNDSHDPKQSTSWHASEQWQHCMLLNTKYKTMHIVEPETIGRLMCDI